MDPLVRYYVHQAVRGHGDKGIGPIYINQPFIQRGHGISSIVGGLCSLFVRPFLWHGAKTVSSEVLAAVRNIITDMKDPDAKFRDVVRRNVRDSAHRVLKMLGGHGRKRKRGKGGKQSSRVTKKKNIKINIFS
jgi:hypothetical protein